MRRMDSAEKRKRRFDDESDRVTEEDYLDDSDPCKSICSREQRWPCSPCVSEGDVFHCMLLNVSLRPKNKVADFYFDLKNEFQTPKPQPRSHFEMLSQMLSEKFSRLATPYSTTLNNTEHDSKLFSETLSGKFSRFARRCK